MDERFYILLGTGLLALTRIVLIFVQAPIFGSHHVPKPILAGMAALFTLVMFPHLKVPEQFPNGIMEFAFALLTQVAVGLVIGFISFLVMAAAQFGGELLDIQMGLSVAASFDPASHGAVNLLRRLHFYIAMQLYLLVNGHHLLIRAIQKSFDVVPLTSFHLPWELVSELIKHTGQLFVLGVQISAPAVGALFVTQCALGLLARVAPQMNVFMLSFPLNIGVGLILLTGSLPVIMKFLLHLFDVNLDQVMQGIYMMRPGG